MTCSRERGAMNPRGPACGGYLDSGDDLKGAPGDLRKSRRPGRLDSWADRGIQPAASQPIARARRSLVVLRLPGWCLGLYGMSSRPVNRRRTVRSALVSPQRQRFAGFAVGRDAPDRLEILLVLPLVLSGLGAFYL
jgi:hypothetical protein